MTAYDFHIHTCLTPAAADDMTPAKVVDRALAKGLEVIAIADRNATDNLAAACEYAEGKLVVIPGIEIQSKEDVLMTCLFPDMLSAQRMSNIMHQNLTEKRNKVKAFGHQYIVDADDRITGEENKLLSFHTNMTIEDIIFAAKQVGGVAFYSNIDSSDYSVFAILGGLPKWPQPKALEFSCTEKGRNYARAYEDRLCLFSSDAMTLDGINSSGSSDDLDLYGDAVREEDGRLTAASIVNWIRSYEG